jgi:Group XII secretory phospholipase A2 precursor (PLA2G12)
MDSVMCTVLKVGFHSFPELTYCCNEHDKCYDTCGIEKGMCEEQFKTCLYSECSALRSSKDGVRKMQREKKFLCTSQEFAYLHTACYIMTPRHSTYPRQVAMQVFAHGS